MSEHVTHCAHGLKGELPAYRSVRIWQMNCGEVRCSLSESDYFLPDFIQEWIDAALDGKTDGWLGLDLNELNRARKAQAL